MAYMTFSGLTEYLEKLQRVEKNTEQVIGKVVYEMAGIVADEVKRNIEALPTKADPEAIKAWSAKEKSPITVSEKKGLEAGFGISPMKNENGFYHVKLGFDGYNETKTKKYPQGQPNVMIARSIESGSSVMDKHPFVRPAINSARKKAEARAKVIIEEEINNIM